jgi:hypothetical protein
MLPSHAVERSLQKLPQDLQDMVLELRNLVAEVAPGVSEKGHSRGYTYYFAERGGTVSAGVCQIMIFEDHLRLAFIHGAFLPDPRHLLEGKTYPKRYVRLTSYDTAPWDYLKELIVYSSHFDPYTQKIR